MKDVLCGLGCHEAWTATFVTEDDQTAGGFEPPYVEVTNPLVESERFLRASMAPGLVRAVLYNTERRQGDVRLFEVGSVFWLAGDPAGDGGRSATGRRPGASECGLRRRGRRCLDGDGGLADHRRRLPDRRVGVG